MTPSQRKAVSKAKPPKEGPDAGGPADRGFVAARDGPRRIPRRTTRDGGADMTFRLKDPKSRNPKVQAILDVGDGDAAEAGRWLADLVRATVKDAEEDVYHRMPTWAVKGGVGFAHVSVYSKHASLGFSRGARLDDKDGLFEPSASATYRAVKVAAPDAVPKAKLVRLVKQAAQLARQETQQEVAA